MSRRTLLSAVACVTMAVAGTVEATTWVDDFTNFSGTDAEAVSNYTDTEGANPNSFVVVNPQAGAVPPGWLTQGVRGTTPTTAKFFNAPGDGGGRARFSTLLPATMDADGGVSFAWTARYGSYTMGRAPIQIAVTTSGGGGDNLTNEFTVYFRVVDGTTMTIQSNGGGLYSTIDALTIPDVGDGLYHQWSCAVITSEGLAHWKLWLDGNLLSFGGTDGAHQFDPGGGAEQFSFQTSFNNFDGPANAPYIGLGELGSTSYDPWDFEFDCVAYQDDGLAQITCGEEVTCDSVVTPEDAQTSAALKGGIADPPAVPYTFVNSGSGTGSYTVAETDQNGNAQEHAWLTLSKSGNASVPPSGIDTVDATISDTNLAAGTYTGYITFTDGCNPPKQHIREINLVITDCEFTVSPAGEIARSVTPGSIPFTPDAVFTVTNAGVDGMTYSVQEDPDAAWLTLNKSSGGPLANGETDPVSAAIDVAGLGTGVHTCTLRFSLTTPGCSNQPADILRTVVVHVLDVTSAFQQFNAEFTSFTGSDLTASSPLLSCDPVVLTTREFHIQPGAQVDQLDAGWLTQGSIEETPTTARFNNPAGASQVGNGTGRTRFKGFLPFDNSYAPGMGMAVAWRMRVGDYALNRGPIQITVPQVTGPYGVSEDTSAIPGQVFNAFIRIQNGTNVRILNNGGGAYSTIETYTLPTSIADEYHQWTAAACYSGGDQMAYWNLWLDGVQLLFAGDNGSVVGPTGRVYSFRTPLEDVTGDPYVGLGDLGTPLPDIWDFEFDWVRMLSYNVPGCPFWDGEGCVPVPACPTPFADADEDGDVDSDDFAAFQRCINTGLGTAPLVLPDECRCFDRNGDKVIGTVDLARFEACGTGPDVMWESTPGCP